MKRSHSLPAVLALCLVTAALGLAACANRPTPSTGPAALDTARRLEQLLPADILLLGEQHDAAEHQHIQGQVLANLASRGLLAALALEMADAGTSTAGLAPSTTDDQVRATLLWRDNAWPWSAYGPTVMAAVRAGVPVLGANLPRHQMQASMADSTLDTALPGAALKAQQQGIRAGHCHLLPESQITPMTRIQIARDKRMADTLHQALVPGKVVLLLSGSGHADRVLGVPQHLWPDLKVKAVRLYAGTHTDPQTRAFDMLWPTPAVPEKDNCAGLREQFTSKPSPAAKP